MPTVLDGVQFLEETSDGTSARHSVRRLALLVLVSVVILSFNFGSRLLYTQDETRFPVMARDVLANGHWLLPALPDGRPHLQKPPLVVWLIALASWPQGSVSVRTATLPSLLEAIGVVLVTYWIGRRLFDPDVGLVASLVAVTTLGVFSFAHSAMPDMAQLVFITGALAAYAGAEFGGGRAWLIAFYGLAGIASMAKGAAGLLPLAIVIVYTLTTHGVPGLRRLVLLPGLALLVLLATPWWVLAAVIGRDRFVGEVVFRDQLIFFFLGEGRHWGAITGPFSHAIAITLPWCLLLPFAIWAALREPRPETTQRLRLLLVWLATIFVIIAVSAQQRQRYYLPLCPAAALLVGWWYSTLAWRRRAVAFACAWIGVVAIGAGIVTIDTPRFNAATDLRALRALLAQAPAPLYAMDEGELVLSFNLDRPVLVSPDYRFFEERLKQGREAYLIISDRELQSVPDTSCVGRVATGVVNGRPFTVLAGTTCGQAAVGRRTAVGPLAGAPA